MLIYPHQGYAQTNITYPVTDIAQYQSLKNPFVSNFIASVQDHAAKNNPNQKKKYLIKNFCDALLYDVLGEGFQYDETFIINPRQSFFLYHLCGGIDAKYHDLFPTLHTILIHQGGRDQPLKLRPKDLCHTSQTNLGDCEIHNIVTPLIYTILDDLYRTKYASLQLYQGPDIQPEDYIKSYARRFWTQDIAFLPEGGYCNNQTYHYLYPESLTDQKSRFCSHPKTFKELKKTAQDMKKLVKKNIIIKADTADMYLGDSYDIDPVESDYSKFCNIYDYPDAPDTTSKIRNLKYDMVRCAFIINHYGANIGLKDYQKAQGSMESFYNLEYNEILMYRLFVTYYQLVAQTNNQFNNSVPKISGSYSNTSKDVSDELDHLAQDVVDLGNQQQTYHKSLGDLAMAFHLFVAHRIYQEDLSVFNKQYGIVITQVSQIRNKLYKAQEVLKNK